MLEAGRISFGGGGAARRRRLRQQQPGPTVSIDPDADIRFADGATSIPADGNCEPTGPGRVCSGRGVCLYGRGVCVCSPGYSGTNCEDTSDELSGGAIAGIVVGSAAAAALVALLAVLYLRRRRASAWVIRYEDLAFAEPIGQGSFGVVFLGSYHGTDVAIKRAALRGRRRRRARDAARSSGTVMSAIASRLRSATLGPDDRAPAHGGEDDGALEDPESAGAPRADGGSAPSVESSPESASSSGGSSSAGATTLGTRTSRVREEIKMLAKLRHPKVCLLMGASIHDGAAYIVMEYCARGSLDSLLSNPSIEVDNDMRMSWLSDIATGMAFLHKSKPPVVHRDLKPKNILIDEKFTAKVADFGLSISEGAGADHYAGTVRYMAPERLDGRPAECPSDVFSFGILMWEVFADAAAYAGTRPEEIAAGVRKAGLRPEPTPLSMSNKIVALMQVREFRAGGAPHTDPRAQVPIR